MAGSAKYTAVLDANVLYPNTLRNILLSLASEGLYHAKWTTEITNEWVRNLLVARPDISKKIDRLVELVSQAVPDYLVEDYEHLIPSITLPDAKDRHVVAAAIKGHADAIVTFNLKDFPLHLMDHLAIDVQHPDDFLMNQLQLRQFDALEVIRNIRNRLRNPPYDAGEFVDLVARNRLPQTAQYLQGHTGLI
jgi:predicted nucleic acid-binding protein